MPERIVDLLELVEIDEEHGTGLARMPHGSQRLVDLVAEIGSVRQARQRVIARHMADLGLGALALGDVLDEHDRTAVLHRLEGQRKITPIQRVDNDVAGFTVGLVRLELHGHAFGRVFGNQFGPHTFIEHLPDRHVLLREIMRDVEQLAEAAVADDQALHAEGRFPGTAPRHARARGAGGVGDQPLCGFQARRRE